MSASISTPVSLQSSRPYIQGADVGPGVASPVLTVLFMLLHLPLALAFHLDPILPTFHAIATLAIGLWWLYRDPQPYRVINVAAYITGSETLWRATGASVFWEFGKYSVSLLLLLALIRHDGLRRADRKPVLYFLLLIPSVFLLPAFNREYIAFNLAGPFVLAISTMFFSTVTLTRDNLKGILLCLLSPLAGLAYLAHSMMETERVVFGHHSMYAASAGFGPNQVSAVLGLGALAAFLYLMIERRKVYIQAIMLGLLLWLTAQSMLTFSRGGFWSVVCGIALAGFHLCRTRKARSILVPTFLTSFVLTQYWIIPALDKYTRGEISARFRSVDSTGRDVAAIDDLIIFRDNPLLGVGPGMSEPLHNMMGCSAGAHTEFTRMLSEHGSLGLLALLILVGTALQRILQRTPPSSKAYIASFTFWSLFYMAHAATRLVAPSFVFGLASARFLLEDETSG